MRVEQGGQGVLRCQGRREVTRCEGEFDGHRARSRAPSWSAGAIAARSTSWRRKQDVEHRVIPWDDVGADEGTGIVHIAPGRRQGGLRALEGSTISPSSRRSTSSASMSTGFAG